MPSLLEIEKIIKEDTRLPSPVEKKEKSLRKKKE